MSRYIPTDADRERSRVALAEMYEAIRMRREAELLLLEKMRREAAMPEWYPHQ